MTTRYHVIRPSRTIALVCGLLIGLPGGLTAANSGDTDPSYGEAGSVALDFAEGVQPRLRTSLVKVQRQEDGRIVVLGDGAGRIFVSRYQADGTLDTSFGIGGITTLTQGLAQGTALTVLSDGRILVGGIVTGNETPARNPMAVWRLGSNGRLDLTWNQGRPVFSPVPDGERNNIAKLLPQADGGVLAVGNFDQQLALFKITADGRPDQSFAAGGLRQLLLKPGGTYSAEINGALQLPDGRILVTGTSSVDNPRGGLLLARLTAAGQLDTSLNGKGYRTIFFGSPPSPASEVFYPTGFDLALQSDGSIVIIGKWNQGKDGNSAIVRFTPDGAWDITFGTLSGFQPNDNSGTDLPCGLVIRGDDRIVTAGSAEGVPGWVALNTADGKREEWEQPLAANGLGISLNGISGLPDGRFIVVGEAFEKVPPFSSTVLLARINATGTTDTTFGGAPGGLVRVTVPRHVDVARDLILSGGKAVLSAQSFPEDYDNGGPKLSLPAVARVTSGGVPDPTFSGDGRVLFRASTLATTASQLIENPSALAADSSGRVYVATTAEASPSIVQVGLFRYLADGALDTGFGTGGKISPALTSLNLPLARVAVQSDGKPLFFYGGNGPNVLALNRYTTTGALDTSFSEDGRLDLLPTFGLSSLNILTTADGKILVVGPPKPVTGVTADVAVLRLNNDGSPDTTFGPNGVVKANLGLSRGVNRVVVQPDGKLLLLSGASGTDQRSDGVISRLTAAGAIDTGFGTGGKLTYSVSAGSDVPAGATVDADGRILVAGTVDIRGYDPVVRVSRHLANGSLDTTFGTGGAVQRDAGIAGGIVVQADGKILVAASRDGDAVLYRYLPVSDTAPIAILADRTTVGVAEGSNATVGVRLGSAPTGTVTVTAALSGGGDPDLRVTGGATLVFTAANWSTYQVVTLAAQADADTSNGSATLVLSASGLTGDAVAVSEIDDGRSPVQLLSPSSLIVAEGGSATLPVRLTAAPSANVVVTAAIQSGGDPSLTLTGGASLTFTPANWNTPQNVTIAAATDADTANGTANLRLSASGLVDVFVGLTESDAGAPPVATIAAAGDATEGGATGSVVISLSKAATGSLSMGFVVDAGGTASPSDYTLNRTSPVTIAAGQTSATITVTATADALNEGTETLRINLLAGTGYTVPTGVNQAVVSILDGASTGNQPPVITIRSATESTLVLP